MKQILQLSLSSILLLGVGLTQSWSQATTFSFTGAVQTYTVPLGVTSIQLETWGAQGGTGTGFDGVDGTGGLGGYSIGNLAVTPGQVLEVYVGGDKVLHLVLAFVLSLLSMMSFSRRFSEWKILAFLMLILTTEETLQLFLPNRYFGFDDLVAGFGGLICGNLLYKLMKILTKNKI